MRVQPTHGDQQQRLAGVRAAARGQGIHEGCRVADAGADEDHGNSVDLVGPERAQR